MDEQNDDVRPASRKARASALLYFVSEGEWGSKYSDEYQKQLGDALADWFVDNFAFGLVIYSQFRRFVDYMTRLLSRH